MGEFGDGLEAVASVSAEGIKASQGGEDSGDGGLEAGETHLFRVQVGCGGRRLAGQRVLASWAAQAPQIMAMGWRPAMAQPSVGMPRAT